MSARGGDLRRKQPEGDDHGGNDADEDSEDPHERASEDLVSEGSHAKNSGVLVVRGIEDTIAKDQECAENASRHHAKEKIERNSPAWPASFGGERLDNRPPEKDGSGEETRVFDFMPDIRTESEFKGGGNMPGEEC